ncbi:MAG: hypothetical protein IPI73_25920 [Betaproteobacteria bacterium]|nr:hypothetical protein [Betaproteobacteria bacterium]
MRYSLGDIIQISAQPCSCGWRGLSFAILGRSDDMLIVKGVNVYPAAIRNVVASFAPRTTGQIRVVLDKPGHKVTPPLHLVVEHGADLQGSALATLDAELQTVLHDQLKIRPGIALVPPGTLQRSSHKTKLVEVRAPRGSRRPVSVFRPRGCDASAIAAGAAAAARGNGIPHRARGAGRCRRDPPAA